MALVLSILRCPDAATPGTRSIPGGDFTLGRAEGCDWVLPDPDRLLSRRHCVLEFRDGFWGVRDLSANGTFVNASSVPIGKDRSAGLEDGDRIRLGAYEFEARIEGASAAPGLAGAAPWSAAPDADPWRAPPAPPAQPYGGSLAPAPFGASPFDPAPGYRPDPRTGEAMRDPFAGAPEPFVPAAPIRPVEGFVPVGDERPPPRGPEDRPPMTAPPAMDFDPFADPKPGPSRGDHSPAASDAFVPPRAHFGAALPEDWNTAPSPPPSPGTAGSWREPDWDALLGDLGPGGAPKPAAPVMPDPLAQAIPTSFPPHPEPASGADPFAPGAGTSPFAAAPPPADPFAPAGFGTAPAPSVEATPRTTAAFPAGPLAPAGFGAAPAATGLPAPVGPAPIGPGASPADPFAEQPGYAAATAPRAAPAPAPDFGGARGGAVGIEAFLLGANLPPLPPGADPDAALHAAGVALRAAIGGLRALLIARADVKRAFRIEGTMLSRRDNNPVKFSATDEASIAALLTLPNGAAAVEETVADLTLHQVAALAATQAAARALLDRVSPAEVEAANPGGGGLLGGREKALWNAYKASHAKLIEQFEDDFDSAFGRAFARAYEEAARAAKRG